MARQPNFLFLFSDQHRGDWMPYSADEKKKLGVEELELDMPNIRSLMDRGTSFLRAITPAPICAPARACLASGKRFKNCRVFTNQVNYDPCLETFYKKLNKSGYYVCGVGKFDLNKGDLDWGDGYHDVLQRSGFSYAEDSEGKMDTIWAASLGKPGPYGSMLKKAGWLEPHTEDMLNRGSGDHPTPLPDELYADNWITGQAINMLDRAPKDKPWFMQVNFSGPHDPWDITVQMKKAMEGRVFPDAADCSFADKNQGVRQNYAAMIENIDKNIGEIIEAVGVRGDLDNTIIIYGADHGEMMGDHSLYGKAKPEQGSIHIPMVVDASRFDGIPVNSNWSPVELQDLAATFLDYAGIDHEGGTESVSLRPIISGDKDKVRDYALSELIHPNQTGLYTTFGTIHDGQYKLIMRTGIPDRLYDLTEDPFECNEISAENADTVQRLKDAFGERGQANNPLRPLFAAYAKSFNA